MDTKRQKSSPTFEQALEQLESIVDSMESGDIPLADLIAKFEQGSKLLLLCEERLKNAEMRIELLKKQKSGDAAFEDFPSPSDEETREGRQ